MNNENNNENNELEYSPEITKFSNALKNDLAHCTGTTSYYQHLTGLNYTDGVQICCETAQCYWALDLIMLQAMLLEKEPFQVHTITLKAPDGGGWTHKVSDGNGNELYRKKYDQFTTLMAKELRFFFENNVLCLPQER